MNKQMIEKINKINNNVCPEFAFDNPLLDRNVTNALSKSFVKILDVLNPNSNNNLRLSVLEVIRKCCQTESNDHIKIDDHLSEIITEFHCSNLKQKTAPEPQENVEKALDAFLLRRIENCELSAKYKSRLNPEIIQSLINLKQEDIFDILSKDVINWNVKDSKQSCILKEIFMNDHIKERKLLDDIFIKMTPELEKFFLEIAQVLIDGTADLETLFSDDIKIKQLIKTCSISPQGFQICCSILNFIFITSNYNLNVQRFIAMFVNHIKTNCTIDSFHSLYPIHVNHIVLLLDFNDEELSQSLRNVFIKETIKYLKLLHNKETDLIMLLSHFPRWFDIYFDSEYCTN